MSDLGQDEVLWEMPVVVKKVLHEWKGPDVRLGLLA